MSVVEALALAVNGLARRRRFAPLCATAVELHGGGGAGGVAVQAEGAEAAAAVVLEAAVLGQLQLEGRTALQTALHGTFGEQV